MLRGIGAQKSYTESKMQKGQWFLPSRGVPPSWSQKMLQINNSIRKLLYKKRKLYFVFSRIPRFSCIYFFKNKISQTWNGVYVKGSSEVWQWSRIPCIYCSEKQITWCCYRVYVKGNRSPKKLHRIQNAEVSMISALSWGPPFLEPKCVTNQQFYKETCVQKTDVVFCFFGAATIFLYLLV